MRGVRVQTATGNPRRERTSATGAPIDPKPMTPTENSLSAGRRRPAPAGLALLLLERRQAAIMRERHQRHVLRHAHALQRIDRAHDGDVAGQVGGRDEIVGAGAGAGDEAKRGKMRRDARRHPEGENRLDLSGRCSAGIGVDGFLGRQRPQRGELPLHERGRWQHEDRHGRGRNLRRLSAFPVKC